MELISYIEIWQVQTRKIQVRIGRNNLEGRTTMAGVSASPVSIVLVHGGFVDGAGWEGVYNGLNGLAGAVGRQRSRRVDQRTRLEDQAELVSGCETG
jgi:hypothetical protein